jgi:hypothetical protein
MLQQSSGQNQQRALKVLATKRKAERVKSSFSGAVIVDGEFVCHCVIADVSNTGMQLAVPKNTNLPDEFAVKTPAVQETLNVKTAWVNGNNVGVIIMNEDGAE